MKNYLKYTIREVDGKLRLFDGEGNIVDTGIRGLWPDTITYVTVWGVFQYKKPNGFNELIFDGTLLWDTAPTAEVFQENNRIGWKTPSGDLLLPPIFDQIEICDGYIFAHFDKRDLFVRKTGGITEGPEGSEDGEFYENGKKGIRNPDGTILFPAIYDEIYSWGDDCDVYYTRIGDEFHYYNSKHEEILTTYRKFDGVDDKCEPYYISEEQNRDTLVTMQIVDDLSDSQSCVCFDENVRLDRILKSEVDDIVRNNCEVWDKGLEQLDYFHNVYTYIYSAYYAQSKSSTPIEDCVKQFEKMECFESSWGFIIKIWTNRNTKISIAEMNKLVYYYQDIEFGLCQPMDCVTIGYDDSLEDGMVKMFQVIFATDRMPNELDDIDDDSLSGTIDNYKEKKQLLLDTLEEYREKKNWTDEVYQSYYNEFFLHNEIGGDYSGFVFEEEKELLDYLVYYEEEYSAEKTAFYVCQELFHTAWFDDINEVDIRNAYKKIKWAILPDQHSNFLAVCDGKSSLDYIRASIDKIMKFCEKDKDSKIAVLKEIEQLLLDEGFLTAAEIRSININPLNMYYLKNDANKPIAEHIDRCRVLYEVLLMQDCEDDPIEVGKRTNLDGVKNSISTAFMGDKKEYDYVQPDAPFPGFVYNLSGKVESIIIQHQETIDGKCVETSRKAVNRVDGWSEGETYADYYIVTLTDVTVIEDGYSYTTPYEDAKRRREIVEMLRGKNNAE
ncbi:MAG: hypothetical protein J6T98_08885 [Salinivirgaceae bacterium]|nr:hypothetical protein [Salinivirgaceae bacterium]